MEALWKLEQTWNLADDNLFGGLRVNFLFSPFTSNYGPYPSTHVFSLNRWGSVSRINWVYEKCCACAELTWHAVKGLSCTWHPWFWKRYDLDIRTIRSVFMFLRVQWELRECTSNQWMQYYTNVLVFSVANIMQNLALLILWTIQRPPWKVHLFNNVGLAYYDYLYRYTISTKVYYPDTSDSNPTYPLSTNKTKPLAGMTSLVNNFGDMISRKHKMQ